MLCYALCIVVYSYVMLCYVMYCYVMLYGMCYMVCVVMYCCVILCYPFSITFDQYAMIEPWEILYRNISPPEVNQTEIMAVN